MRTKEQFKAYVYQKAEAKRKENTRMRNIWLRGVAACSLLIVIGIVALFGGIGIDNVTEDLAPAEAEPKLKSQSTYTYSAVLDGAAECVLETECAMLADDAASNVGAAGTGLNILEIAKKECTVEYDTYTVEYDEPEELWIVVFYTEGVAGGDQTVYIGTDGSVNKIVYGE